ncbi:aminotransferase class V-fold PLP-dependent enzyme [Umezawaea tangerina]|uniref:Selenocysteine lyase/cysteine desulfurase n=1 Tax=Umezawaea tangerina TaxID=84725 RepID=A0A2T0THS8_9PSEU|nr:aminotransferase class V-fold PLP-dependent enzyme [Umezawaea tangerina]PRY45230.1 selenocysteine lyase/cysteine desulfurase [Umezawaea tangerina]
MTVTTRGGALTAAAFRARFPVLGRKTHLSSCSLGARSDDLDHALLRMVDDMTAGGGAWEAFEGEFRRARKGFADLIGAHVDQVALVPNASTGAYQVASTLDYTRRWKVVSTVEEFPSVSHVWLGQRPRGADVVHATAPQDYERLVDRRTRLVSVPLVTYARGHRMPVDDVVRAARAAGAAVFVDAYQAIGVHPVDVGLLDCDFLVAGAMKYLPGLPGLAFLYVRSPDLTDRDPRLTGWFGRVDPFAFDPAVLDFPRAATRFETGTPAVPACYAANAALGLIGALDLAEVRMHVLQLTELAADLLSGQGEEVRALPSERRGAHIGLVDPDPGGLARLLAERDVSVSPRGDAVRLSFHYYNNTDDVAALCSALADLRSSARVGR